MATEAGAEREAAAATKNEDSNGYTSAEITVLRGLDPVRKRPGMYIGSTGPRGLHHLVYEVVDNSVDEALAGYCDKIELTLHPDNAVTVDRQRPRDPRRRAPRGEAARRRGRAHHSARRRQVRGEGGGYKVSGGLHGVGVSVVNALSERLHLEVRRDGTSGPRTTSAASRRADLKRGDKIKGTGTTITFAARRRGLRDARVRLRDARRADARDRLPHPRARDLAGRRARRRPEATPSSTRAGSSTSSST